MNITLLNQIKEKILQYPDTFNMAWWKLYGEGCNTTMCIAGHALCLINAPLNHWGFPACYATEALELTEEQANRLFYSSAWPMPYLKAYNRYALERDPRMAAKVAAKRIDHFIATNGQE